MVREVIVAFRRRRRYRLKMLKPYMIGADLRQISIYFKRNHPQNIDGIFKS